jgi:peptidoglycan hydrolase-like protein with peptidoglycan-binding domain
MKRLVVVFVAVLALSLTADSHAQRKRRPTAGPVKKPHMKKRNGRAKATTPAPLASEYDELVLSPALTKQLQSALIDGGYLAGTANGRLTPRTRRALAAYQRGCHLVGTGALDRATAEGLLGRDRVGASTAFAARQ